MDGFSKLDQVFRCFWKNCHLKETQQTFIVSRCFEQFGTWILLLIEPHENKNYRISDPGKKLLKWVPKSKTEIYLDIHVL